MLAVMARPLGSGLVWGVPLVCALGWVGLAISGANTPLFLTINGAAVPAALWAGLTALGDTLTALSLLLILSRWRPDIVVAGLLAALVALLATHIPKHVFDMARPVAVLGDAVHVIGPLLRHGSFPSGHTATAFTLLALVTPYLTRMRHLLWLAPLVLMVGISRVGVGAHWPADVLAGALVGWLSGMAGVGLAHRFGMRHLHEAARLFLVACALYFLTVYDSGLPQSGWLEQGIALVALLSLIRPVRWPELSLRCAWVILLSVCATLAIWRWWARQHAGVELFFDEAYYWGWSRHLDWGYYSKPPMVAWIIRLGTELFGPGETGIRAGAALLYPLTTCLVFLFTRRLFARETHANELALAAGLTFITLPVVGFGGWFMTTDAPLMFFWALAQWLYLRVLDDPRWRNWLMLGLALGLGALSKYTMVFFIIGMAFHLSFSPPHRAWLKSPRLYATLALALALLSPNLAWNAAHQFASFRHTAEISHLDQVANQPMLHPAELGAFVSAQFGLFGPLLFAGLLWLALRRATWEDARLRLLASFWLPAFLAFCGLALATRAFANWAAFAYVSASALIAGAWWLAGRRRWLTAALVVNLTLTAGLYHWHDLAHALDKALVRKTDPYHRVRGWRELGRQVAEELAAHPGARLAGEGRDLLAQIGYYGGARAADPLIHNPTGRIRNHYDLVADLRTRPQGEFIYITYASDAPLKWFREGELLRTVSLPLLPDLTRVTYVWRVRDYLWPTP